MPGKIKKANPNQNQEMKRLTSRHIEQIRNYFVADSEDDRKEIYERISHDFLREFLDDLNRVFIHQPENENELFAIANRMGATKYLDALKEIQYQFFDSLAEQYLNGHKSADIEESLSTGNRYFTEAIDYHRSIGNAFALNERRTLYEKIKNIERETFIGDTEITNAFKLIERKKLKGLFVSNEEENRRKAVDLLFDKSPIGRKEIHKYTLQWPEGSLKKSILKQIAIAASLIGIIATTTIIIFNQAKKPSEVVINNPKINRPETDTNQEIKNQTAIISPTLKPIPSEENRVKILMESSFGFAKKDEYINVEVHYLENYLKSFKDSINNEMNTEQIEINNKTLDSLSNFLNKYSLHGNTLQIYIGTNQEVKVFKIDSNIYCQIGETIYETKKSESLLPLRKVTDKQTIESIEKILFNEQE